MPPLSCPKGSSITRPTTPLRITTPSHVGSPLTLHPIPLPTCVADVAFSAALTMLRMTKQALLADVNLMSQVSMSFDAMLPTCCCFKLGRPGLLA